MHLNAASILIEYSHTHDLTCQQRAAGESKVVCRWEAEPPAPFYEIVLTTTEGSEIFKKNVSINYAAVELNDFVGKTISVSVKNSLTNLKLIGMCMNPLFYGFRCYGQKLILVHGS